MLATGATLRPSSVQLRPGRLRPVQPQHRLLEVGLLDGQVSDGVGREDLDEPIDLALDRGRHADRPRRGRVVERDVVQVREP